ncbi:MAG: acetyl-CoA carboxylase carboxyltransferase subunit beta [Victivallales bacterium]|nr:acetyl-CoA carboxylase carboxyltransferase subunit beta [Victivallales bacterium]
MQLFKRRNKYSTLPVKKKEIPQGLWDKCKNCNEVVYRKLLKENLNVCPKCNFHHPLDVWERMDLLTDKGSFMQIDEGMESVDTLKFEGVASYAEKLESNKRKTGMNDAIVCGTATLDGRPFALGVMDFRFLGASMGSVVGEKVTRLTELATSRRLPLVIVTASGGARMYEGMLSLMQMAKTSGALQRHKQQNLPYIVVMTHPTTAGVTASFASLGDLTLAEPKALIGFAGPRVIKDTTQAELPEGFQTSEFLLKKGMIDRIVNRSELRKELSLCLEYLGSWLLSEPAAQKEDAKGKKSTKPKKGKKQKAPAPLGA